MQRGGHPNWPWWRAVGAMIGGVVGVGVFGLPYAFEKSGFVIGLIELLVLGGLLLVLQLMYAEVVLQTYGRHRIVGYMRIYLGEWAGRVAAFLFTAYGWGAMLAFMLIGGTFLQALLGPIVGGDVWLYQLAMAAIAGALTFRGISHLARAELFVISGLLFLFVFIVLASLPHLIVGNLLVVHPADWFSPYGVVFFSLSGLGVIPELRDVLGRQIARLPQAVVVGMAVIVVLYAAFTFAVIGVTGAATTEAALTGLAAVLGRTFTVVGTLLGVVAVTSIFSVLATELQSTFRFDYNLTLFRAWLLTFSAPLILFVIGVNEFIQLIGFLGAVFGGIIGVMVVFMYERMRRSGVCKSHRCLNVPTWVSVLLILIFAGGIVQTFIHG